MTDVELTDNQYELDILRADHLDYIEPDDPHYQEMTRITSELAHISRSLNAKRRNVARLFCEGLQNVEIAEKLGISPQTVGAALKDKKVQRQIALIQRRQHIQGGPSREARQAMLWRIALRSEAEQPAVAIRAVDTMNKADGTYMPAADGAGGLVVNIKNFTLNAPAHEVKEEREEKDITPAPFAPITVTVPDANA